MCAKCIRERNNSRSSLGENKKRYNRKKTKERGRKEDKIEKKRTNSDGIERIGRRRKQKIKKKLEPSQREKQNKS